jgi:hypothetical protein
LATTAEPAQPQIQELFMSNATSLKVISLRPSLSPRVARIAGAWFAAVWSAAKKLLAGRPAGSISPAEEAEKVRQMAYQVQGSNPSFANDLLVAAALHEARLGK